MRTSINLKLVLTFFFCQLSFVQTQSNNIYYHHNPSPVQVGSQIEISQVLFTNQNIIAGTLFFRDRGEESYQEVEMSNEGVKWVGYIPSDRVTLNGIEYLTILTKFDGGKIALPLKNNPFANPLIINVKPKLISSEKKRISEQEENFTKADILILSPEDGSTNRPDEIVISLSLFNAGNIDRNDYMVFIDDTEYTNQTIISGDVLSLVPAEELDYGFHTIKILFKTTYGMDVEPIQWSFNISKAMGNVAESFKYDGSIFAKSSSNTASSISINENQYSGKINAELSWVKARYSFRRSSRESKYLQPVNRNTFNLQLTDYLKINNGDVYPSISPFILDGKKVNGNHLDFNAFYKFGFDGFNIFGIDLFSFDLKIGMELQSVSGTISNAIQYQKGFDRAYELLSNDIRYGDFGNRIYVFDRNGYTFPREISARRLAFSFNDIFKIGIHYLKAKDDFEVIRTKASESSLFTVDTSIFGDSLAQPFTLSQFIDSLANGDTVKIKEKNWNNGTPQENLVLGFDFEGSLDNRKILFQMGWNLSLTNYNIWAGAASKDSLDVLMDSTVDNKLLGTYDISEIGNFIDTYKDIFTINPLHMVPILPIDPIAAEENSIRAAINMPSSAFYMRLKGSYSFNNLLVEYKQLGPEYNSFGNPYLTNNIREFTVNDRLSLFGRRLMFLVGYKFRDNKLSELIANPITTKTISFNTTLVPGVGAPSIILNIQTIGKTNGIDSIETDQYGNFLSDSRENSQALNIMGSINFPSNFKNFTTTSSINLNSITYEDNLSNVRNSDYFFQKAETQTISATVSARFNFPLKTTSTFNNTKVIIPFLDQENRPQMQTDTWTSIITSMQYSFFENKIRTRAGIDFTTNGKKDNSSINLYGAKLGGDWDIIDKLTLSFNSSIRVNNNSIYDSDDIDNDNDGIIDEKSENWSINSSGFHINLGYRF